MNIEAFLKPRMTGTRFEGHAIPLEFLKDLAVLEEMIVEVAKYRFLKENPGRQRSPRGFTEGVQLRLTGVEDGSAIPVISLFIAASTFFPAQQPYFEQARDAIVSAIGAAEQNKPITAYLPEKALTYFDRIGRSLRDGEAIEFTTPAQTTPARLTKETRRKLVLASSTVQELSEATSTRGAVPEADQDNMTFEIQLIDGRKIKSPMATQHREAIVEAFTGYEDGVRVLLDGVGKFNRQGRLQSFESVEHITVLDPLDIPARLDELRTLKDGWLDGKGTALGEEGIVWLTQAFEQHYPDDVPLPFVYPTAEGGIQAEWSLAPHEITLEIDLGKHTGEWHVLNMTTDAEESQQVNLDDPKGWEWLVAAVRRMAGGAA